MFGFLKKGLKKVVDSISDKIKGKKVEPSEEKKAEEKISEVRPRAEVAKPLTKKPKSLTKKEEKTKEIELEPVTKEVTTKTLTTEPLTEEVEEKKGFGFFRKIKEFVQYQISEDDFNDLFEQLEMILIENNVAMQVIDGIKESLRKELVNKTIKKKEVENKIKDALRHSLESLLLEPFDFIEKVKEKKPFVIVFFGINGSGKTTTIAKIVNLLQKNNISSVLAASDTFRAASIEQLEKHGSALGVKVIKHKYGADPAAVAFDAISYAKSKGIDAVLVDTAGRMHTQANLMQEMGKICRVAKPDLRIFIGESIVGNDAVEQAKAFNDAIGIDAIILSKADVDEKGGAAISVSKVTGKPIIFLGMGQKYGDLERFNKEKIIRSLGL